MHFIFAYHGVKLSPIPAWIKAAIAYINSRLPPRLHPLRWVCKTLAANIEGCFKSGMLTWATTFIICLPNTETSMQIRLTTTFLGQMIIPALLTVANMMEASWFRFEPILISVYMNIASCLRNNQSLSFRITKNQVLASTGTSWEASISLTNSDPTTCSLLKCTNITFSMLPSCRTLSYLRSQIWPHCSLFLWINKPQMVNYAVMEHGLFCQGSNAITLSCSLLHETSLALNHLHAITKEYLLYDE